MDKSLGTLAFLGRFPIYTGPTPPLTLQTKLDACIQNLFRVSTLYRVGEGELQENFEKDALFYEGTLEKFRKGYTVLWGNPEVTENCEYCSTVPRTFVHDCNNNTATLTQTCLCHSGPRTNCWTRTVAQAGSSSCRIYHLPEQCPRRREKGHYGQMVRSSRASGIWLQKVHEHRKWAAWMEGWGTSFWRPVHGECPRYIEGNFVRL